LKILSLYKSWNFNLYFESIVSIFFKIFYNSVDTFCIFELELLPKMGYFYNDYYIVKEGLHIISTSIRKLGPYWIGGCPNSIKNIMQPKLHISTEIV